MKSFFKEYLSFAKQDRNAILFLVFMICVIVGIKFFVIPYFKIITIPNESRKHDSLIKLFTAQIEAEKHQKKSWTETDKVDNLSDIMVPKTNSFTILIHQPFNPNEYVFEDWKNAGFPDKFAKTISNYLSKGGKIRKPKDLKKVYGMKDEWYEKIEPYIAIPEFKKENKYIPSNKYVKPLLSIVDLNTADSAVLEALPLIGGKTAIRIIKYRNLLGGFVSLNQLKEVWGFKDSMLLVNEKRITIDAAKISKININSISMDQLKKHPYIKFNKAKLLIAYREQHGKYHAANELKNTKAFTDEDVLKLAPYLIFE